MAARGQHRYPPLMRWTLYSIAALLTACSQSPAADTKSGQTPDKPGSVTKADSNEKKAPVAQVSDKAQTPPKESPAPIAADAKVTLGAPAPDFTLNDLDGAPHKLSDFAGKTVVLEWFNPECPFVNHAHTKGSLVEMAKQETEQGVVWLAINSGAPGKQGYGAEVNKKGVQKFNLGHTVLLDETGAVGRAYGAQKTPHMYLIDDKGVLQYHGAIDNAPFGEVDGGGPKVNHLAAALEELRSGKPISTAETPPYGCTVKYAKG